jgi:hypothetical protein
MSTGKAALDRTQYVKISNGDESLVLQSHRDTVRIAVSELQPTIDNEAFHEVGGAGNVGRQNILNLNYVADPVWALAMTDNSSLSVTAEPTPNQVGLGSGINLDAWKRQKVVIDRSVFHGMFTFSIPRQTWKELRDDVEQPLISVAQSIDGEGVFSSGTLDESIRVSSYRFPRYEPNRGHLFSTAGFLDNPTAAGERNFGLFYEESGVFFRLKSSGLFGVIRTTIGGVTTDSEYLIDASRYDLSKGNTFDIQFQWRGVGDYLFYINQKLTMVVENLGKLDHLSMYNPALPVSFECINSGDPVTIRIGCVDVTSEGGENNGKTYGSIAPPSNERTVSITGPNQYNTPVLVVHNKKTVGTVINTRDVLSLLASAYSSNRAIITIYVTRDDTAITLNDQVYTDYGDGRLEYVTYDLNADGSSLSGTPIEFDTTKAQLVFSAQIQTDSTYATSALFEGRTEIYQSPGDYFIFAMHRDNGGSANVGVTYEFGEAI